MSKIKELVQSRLNELAIIESRKEEELPKPDMTTTSVRLRNSTVNNLELISKELELTRSDLIREFLNAGVREALIELQIDPANWAQDEYTELEGELNE